MDIAQILSELKQERDRIDAVIEALGGFRSSNGRRRGARNRRGTRLGKRTRRLSVAARKKISQAVQARWDKAKKAGQNSL